MYSVQIVEWKNNRLVNNLIFLHGSNTVFIDVTELISYTSISAYSKYQARLGPPLNIVVHILFKNAKFQ